MKIITFEDILKLNISPFECFEWVSSAIEEKKKALLPAKISLKPEIEGVFYNTMPVILPSIKATFSPVFKSYSKISLSRLGFLLGYLVTSFTPP